MLRSYHLCRVHNFSVSPGGNPAAMKRGRPAAPPPAVSVSAGLPLPDVSYQRDPTTRGLLCLASFTEHHVLEVHPWSLYLCPIPFYGQIIFHCLERPHPVCPFISRWTFLLLPPLGYCDWCCCEHLCAGFCLNTWLHSFGYTSRSGLAGSCGHSIFNFLRTIPTAAPFCIPTSDAEGPSFPTSLPTPAIFCCFDRSRPGGREMSLHCDSGMHLPSA